MPIIDPEELERKVLSVTQGDGETTRIKIIEAVSDHHDANRKYKLSVNFKCSVINDAYEKVLSYNLVLEYLVKDDNDFVWKFKETIGYQDSLIPSYKDYKGSMYNLTILWMNGKTSIKPFSLIAADNPVSCVTQAEKNNLISLPGWKD